MYKIKNRAINNKIESLNWENKINLAIIEANVFIIRLWRKLKLIRNFSKKRELETQIISTSFVLDLKWVNKLGKR